MAQTGASRGAKSSSFVGFGFGPIQAGLMLLEAMDSGSFGSYAVVEIDPALVAAVRESGNAVTVNIARRDGIVKRRLSGFRILNPRDRQDVAAIDRTVAEADEMATAIPSVAHYGAGGDASIAGILSRAVNPSKPQLLYAAENHNFAAELLHKEIAARAPEERLRRLEILNTVIGKMSGVIQDAEEMRRLGIEPVVPGWTRAILVEEFSRILVSRPREPGVRRGITVFEEKTDLLPFEEAKLYGHNAIHSLLGYIAAWKGYDAMSRIREDRGLYELGRAAFVEESGAPLIRKHGHLGEPLFTSAGFAAYAEDLMERMTNPYLHDKVERICRDPARKLGFADRLFGTMQGALAAGVAPRRMAAGAAAAVRYARRKGEAFAASGDAAEVLRRLWAGDPSAGAAPRDVVEECLRLVVAAQRRLAEGELPA
jgi:mannitol-1-phosphate 5-dehydrogenase